MNLSDKRKRAKSMQKGLRLLGVIPTGGMVSMDKMHSAELFAILGPTTGKNRPFCEMGVHEDSDHIFWTCPAWKAVRE